MTSEERRIWNNGFLMGMANKGIISTGGGDPEIREIYTDTFKVLPTPFTGEYSEIPFAQVIECTGTGSTIDEAGINLIDSIATNFVSNLGFTMVTDNYTHGESVDNAYAILSRSIFGGVTAYAKILFFHPAAEYFYIKVYVSTVNDFTNYSTYETYGGLYGTVNGIGGDTATSDPLVKKAVIFTISNDDMFAFNVVGFGYHPYEPIIGTQKPFYCQMCFLKRTNNDLTYINFNNKTFRNLDDFTSHSLHSPYASSMECNTYYDENDINSMLIFKYRGETYLNDNYSDYVYDKNYINNTYCFFDTHYSASTRNPLSKYYMYIINNKICYCVNTYDNVLICLDGTLVPDSPSGETKYEFEIADLEIYGGNEYDLP